MIGSEAAVQSRCAGSGISVTSKSYTVIGSCPYINREDLSLSATGRSVSTTSGRIDVTDNNPKTQDSSRRVCDRLNLTRRLLLELDNGDILAGRTMDISPRGALMKPDTPPEGGLLGIAGTLFIISDEGRFSIGYPCKVVRLKDSSIALEIHKKAAAAFGLYMTKDLLGH